jgi:hypothetical protein
MPELANNRTTGTANLEAEVISSHKDSPDNSASHVLTRMSKWALITLILSIAFTSTFFFIALNQPRVPSKTTSLTKETLRNTAGIPKQRPCPKVTPAASRAGTLLYQDTTSCFYFYYPSIYREIEGNLVERHIVEVDQELVDLKYIRVLFSWNRIPPEVFISMDQAKNGEELKNVTFIPDSKAFKVKSLMLGNAKAVMYLVETYRNQETEEINGCRRYFVVQTGKTLTTIEDRISLTPKSSCFTVRKTYPANSLDAMLQSLVVYR